MIKFFLDWMKEPVKVGIVFGALIGITIHEKFIAEPKTIELKCDKISVEKLMSHPVVNLLYYVLRKTQLIAIE